MMLYFRIIFFFFIFNLTSGMFRSSRQGYRIAEYQAPITYAASRSFHTNSVPITNLIRFNSGYEIPTRQVFRWNNVAPTF
jgi:hypothetical protein